MLVDGKPSISYARLTECNANRYQNGDLDFDGNPYQLNEWPDGLANTPTAMRYAGPFTNGQPYPVVQFESDIGGSSNLCNTVTGQDCTVPPISADFYPYWSLNYSQTLAGSGIPAGSCVWNFGQGLPGTTVNEFAGDGEYGAPDIARYGGTIISGERTNPATLYGCGAPVATAPPTISGTPAAGQTLTESDATWSNGSTSYSWQWMDCSSSGANCTTIPSATGQTYTLASTDVGSTIRVEESVPGAGGTVGHGTSPATAVVATTVASATRQRRPRRQRPSSRSRSRRAR